MLIKHMAEKICQSPELGSAVQTSKQRHILGESKLLIGCFNKHIGGSHQWSYLRQLGMFDLY